MRIALLNGITSYPLAGEAGVSERTHSSAANLRIVPSIIVQADTRIRAAATLHRDRLNLATQITFSTTRQFATVRAAEEFARRYDATTPRTGTLLCDSIDPLTALTYRDTYADALVQPPARALAGATVLMDYVVLCGPCTAATGALQTIPTSIDVTGSTNPGGGAINGTYPDGGTFNSRPYYDDGTYEIAWTGTRWEIRFIIGAIVYYYSTDNVPSPDLCTTWIRDNGATGDITVVETP